MKLRVVSSLSRTNLEPSKPKSDRILSKPAKCQITTNHQSHRNRAICSNVCRTDAHNNSAQPTTNNTHKSSRTETRAYRIDSSPLVISERLNGVNYPLWVVLMKAEISGRGMISHINGVSSPPAKTGQAFERWQQQDTVFSRG